jgi:ribose transport system substrate-binding protein
MKKILISGLVLVISISVLLTMVLGSCTPAEEEAAEEPAAEESEAEEPEAEEPAEEEEPEAEEPASENELEGLAVKEDGTPMLLGYITNEVMSGWMSTNVNYTKSLWERAGGEFVTFCSNYDISLEISQVDDLIELEPDAILFHPSDSSAIAPAVEKVNSLGIPTFAVDVAVEAPVISFIRTDADINGAVPAEYLKEVFSEDNPAKIIELMGGLEQSIAVGRRDGFNAVVDEVPYMEVVTQIDTKWLSENAMNAVMDSLERYPDANCVFAHSTMFVPGALNGLDLAGKLVPMGEEGHIVLVSIGSDVPGLEAIRDGYMDASAAHDSAIHAVVTVKAILAYLHGHDVPEDIMIDPLLITEENVDDPNHEGNLPAEAWDEWPVLKQDIFNLPPELVK